MSGPGSSKSQKLLRALVLLLIASAAYLYPFPQANIFYPAIVLLHAFGGIAATLLDPLTLSVELNAQLLDGTERGKELRMRTPLKRFGQVEELVGVCVFLASDAASFVNGQVIAVDGGFLASGVNQ